jgi:hypothetical protein
VRQGIGVEFVCVEGEPFAGDALFAPALRVSGEIPIDGVGVGVFPVQIARLKEVLRQVLHLRAGLEAATPISL